MAPDRPRTPAPAAPGRGWTVRIRVLTTIMAFMTVGLALTGVLTFAAQFRALDQRVTGELWQEYDELALIAENTDESGTPVHTTVDSVLLQATDSAAPSDHESVFTFLDGERRYEPRSQDYSLIQTDAPEHQQVEQELLEAHEPGEAVIVPLQAYDRDLRVLIASVQVTGDESQGVFVVANDIGAQRSGL